MKNEQKATIEFTKSELRDLVSALTLAKMEMKKIMDFKGSKKLYDNIVSFIDRAKATQETL
jgi:hypothetical protein